MIAWFARNDVAANLLMFSILIVGFILLGNKIPLEVFPSVEPRTISVSVSLRGATPEDTEQGIAILVEEAIQDLEGIKQLTSRSSEGSASVRAEIDKGVDSQKLLNEIKSRVDAINNFPVAAEKPIVSLAKYQREVISVVIAGPQSEKEIRQMAEHVRDDILRLDGVTQVELDSVRPYEITIEVNQDILRQYQISLNQISQAIANSSKDLSSGNIKTRGGDVLIRSSGQAYRQDDYENIIILTQSDGSLIRLKDIAKVNDGFDDSQFSSRFNGKNAAFVEVYRIGNQSAIEVADAVKAYLAEKQPLMPDSVDLTYWRDRSTIVKNRLNTLSTNAMQGGILVLLLLTLFLRPAIALWVFIGIPVSFMGAFFLMPVLGVTLNIFSLFAFILVLGIVVDDAIVTGENIYSHLRHSETGLQAAIRGTQEVSVPVTFGILTTIVAFLPLAFIEGRRGDIFAQIPIVVIPILLFSLIESKLVLPAHLKHIKLRQDKKSDNAFSRFQERFADGFENAILKYYQPILGVCLNNKRTTLFSFIGVLLIIISLLASGWMRFTFFPRVESETARASLTMPTGTPYEVTDHYITKMTDAAFALKAKYYEREGIDLILDINSTTGSNGRSQGSHLGRVMFQIVPPEQRELKIGSGQLMREWRGMIGEIPGAQSLTYRAEIGRTSDPVDIQFSGIDFKALGEVGDQVKEQLALYPALFDISDSLSNGKEELQIELNEQAYALGLTRSEVLSQIRAAYFGVQVERIQRGRDDVRVMLKLPKEQRQSVAGLEDLRITTAQGQQLPLSQIATLTPGLSPTTINRIDRYRTMTVTADAIKSEADMQLIQRELREFIDELLVLYPGIHYKFEGEAREQRESFGSMGLGLIIMLFVIYGLLAIPFKSYLQPLIVMSVIPFGIIGAVAGHWIMGMNLTILSVMGMMALVGVVINDSLVLVDYINKHYRHGKLSLQEAVLQAGAARFRPVMLTSLTTFIGLMPLLFEKSTQAQFLIPMAVSLAFGIIFATFITLILVPINYIMVEKTRLGYQRFINS
ncbi:efflux RND transporter permease subunit [Psychrobium sp. 1_MG-2023]|uniref:efflux RND transporter permease subunit n=1 Tax=Psychrobium sp. 1_MG-2023 TaxID=3062624 RepID=UPI000C329605|nr:efflux RND transporter permease subunit [Psychrobium sp. 1_MG-2023]MDP2562700.1 efflux RND transporter permease subunit [Psychrobium sp. 1_MG-2023]PKF54787.1 acriflavine resistance protein B [Alteromonadales bacterium alter-6D02]